jgi:amidohydrolase
MINKALAIKQEMTAWRRDFHMHPELGFKETRTAARIGEILQQIGVINQRTVWKTGVVAELGNGKPVVALRADMDALPLHETNQVSYMSQNPGVMHACGHDSHMAMALGVAVLLLKEKFSGTVRFIFQPSEETADENGLSGAPHLVEAGVMNDVELILATHVEPTTPVGAICSKPGPASGGVDSWFGEIKGRGGHGAHPNETIDPFYIAAHVIFALNGIVSRRLNPFDPAVVSIGSLNGGFTENVIPEIVRITGTLRYTQRRVQEQIHAEIRRAFEITKILGGDYGLKFVDGTPPMINSASAAKLIEEAAVELLGKENILPWKDDLGAEDFGCYLEHAPGAMFALGTASEKFKCQLHNPDFDLDENCLPVGAAVIAKAVLKYLEKA